MVILCFLKYKEHIFNRNERCRDIKTQIVSKQGCDGTNSGD